LTLPRTQVFIIRLVAIVVLAAVFFVQRPAAQATPPNTLTTALFERYVDALRSQTGMPGLAGAIVQGGTDLWKRGLGVANIETAAPVTTQTPFAIGDLTQMYSAALVLRHCVDRGEAELDDAIRRWSATFPDARTTFRQALSHFYEGRFDYTRERFATITPALEECADENIAVAFDRAIIAPFMQDAVPGLNFTTSADGRPLFSAARSAQFRDRLQRMALPYRVDNNRRATPSSSYPATTRLDAGGGLVASVADLVDFDQELDRRFLSPESLNVMRTNAPGSAMGLGVFVQQIRSRTVVWHFGVDPGAYSSLMIKVLPPAGSGGPTTTLYLLANSDGLAAPYQLHRGDISVSPRCS